MLQFFANLGYYLGTSYEERNSLLHAVLGTL